MGPRSHRARAGRVPVPPHMQGQAFLGPQKPPARQYVVAHRDRMDEAYDMTRAVRDPRYKYIRNFFRAGRTRSTSSTWKRCPRCAEWRRMYKEHMNAPQPDYGRALNPVQLLFFAPEKPAEELLRHRGRPHEVTNLARVRSTRPCSPGCARRSTTGRKPRAISGSCPRRNWRERMRPGSVWTRVSCASRGGSAAEGRGGPPVVEYRNARRLHSPTRPSRATRRAGSCSTGTIELPGTRHRSHQGLPARVPGQRHGHSDYR